ncbi:hypothetical protein [Kineosporia babensis]|uniref:Ricin B lectin domain-containing protein n=1 Tax=Kineosporia babensis TaxID=499548 RepID=A0A9X1NCH0_9ACTN|nr:hypothetical protein [Kineosporia babensis]MCD5311309.1 hypothetical protein [Kineosporia babensis]
MARLRGVTAAGILVIGALVTSACGSDSDERAIEGTVTKVTPSSATTSTTEAPESTEATEASNTTEEPGTAETTKAPAPEETTEPAAGDPGLPSSGKGATIVPVDGFEGGLTLEDEGLSMTDDDSGRQLFTFKSLGGDLYQVKGTDSSGENDPLCWRAPDADEISPSPIVAGECDTSKKTQAFKIVKSGAGYVISREGSGSITLGSNGLEYSDTKSTKFRVNA